MGLSHAPRVITDGLTLALDAAPNPRFSNYKGRSVAFDGTGDRLSITSSTDFDIGSAKTWECWFKLDTVSTGELLMGSLSNHWLNIGFSGIGGLANKVGFSILDGSWNAINSTTSIVAGSWYHVAVTWDGTYAKLYLNGVLEVTSADWSAKTWASNNGNPYEISGYSGNDASSIDGSISNLRITDSVLYTSNFTPPTEPLTAVTNTKLLTCQGNTISDASSSAHTITPTGNVVIDYNGPFSGSGWTDLTNRGNSGTLTNGPVFTQEPKLEPFGGAGAVEFSGTGKGLTFPAGSDFAYGTGDFTIEGWFYPTVIGTTPGALSPAHILYSQVVSGTNWLNLVVHENGKPGFYNTSSGGGTDSFPSIPNGSVVENQWQHIALCRDSGTLRLFVNGTQLGAVSNSFNFSSSYNPCIANYAHAPTSSPYNGYISNFRIVKGTALYTSNFTPPRKKLEVTSDTVLLTCEKGTIRDRSSSAHAITVIGGAHLITGASYFEFDGTDDNCPLGPSSDFTPGTGPFTIEMWIYPTATPSQYEGPAYYTGSGVNNTSLFWAYRSGNLDLINNGDSYTLLSMTYPTLNQWVHLVASRDASGYFAVYENGVVKASTTGNSDNYEQNEIYIGGSGAYIWPGKVSVFKMYKGKGLTAAEVTQNFNALRGRYGI
jgi:hypothetical protein